jgi:hypothetical protein
LGLGLGGLALVVVVGLITAGPAAAGLATTGGTIPVGDDLFETEPNNTTSTFDPAFGTGIPSGFFGPACGGFGGTVHLGGEPLDPRNHGDADTVVRRLSPGALNPTANVPIEIVELSLVSMEPISVQCDGQETLWDLTVGLSDQQ